MFELKKENKQETKTNIKPLLNFFKTMIKR